MTEHHSWDAAEKLPREGLIAGGAVVDYSRSRGKASRRTWLGRVLVLVWLYYAYTAVKNIQARHATVASEGYRVGDIRWEPCTGDGEVEGAECGYAVVPLDWTDSSAGTAKIALGRYNSTSGKRKGSVFLNPGGPGSPGKWLATQMGPYVQMLLGEDYDIIGFDPRGVGETEPRTQCFPSPEAHAAFIANTPLERGFDVGPNLTDPMNREHLIQLQRHADALWQTKMQVCAQSMGDKLRYMGTVSIARDVEFIASLLDGKDAPINYYGLSYGTVLGQLLINMFPDRVGRVVLDGIVDAVEWTSLPAYKWERHLQQSAETAYEMFMTACAEAGPSRCALAKKENEDPKAILSRVEDFVEGLYFKPLAVPNATAPGILTNGRARLFLLSAIELPESWPLAAIALELAMNGDGSALLDAQRQGIHYDDLQRSAISCNDNTALDPPTAEEVIDEQLWVLQHVTRFSLAVVALETDWGCHHWPVSPPERFSGPWNHTLSNPILLVSNTADPITPMANGLLLADRFSGFSRHLVQDSAGHCALALPSLCMIMNVRAFFADGTLPDEGAVCPMDSSPFPDPEDTKAYSAEDRKLLEGARHVANAMLRN
ncbi:hypothetical protein BN946_scf184962.g77 [Trametes cinnabarina]|uniref:AB hydrolase-1 domain-containing protein n=1 Tax=Pycnoporus cinnabarinus TaxID=5643 RepID=A0A060SIR7_PYCCI|nr:hypothetical protein BN946_scf184962.g77 [Trametes cinnabarina]